MKKRLLFLTVFVGALLFLNLTPLSLQVNEGSESDFEIRVDGTVRIDGFIFKSLSEYVSSDYFRIMGKRCLIKGRGERPHIEASTADCTLSRTNIQNEYWPSNTYTIPIVFHVISKTDGTGNIADQRIYDQVDVLNEDYRATSGTPGSQGFDTMIQFELAAITRTTNNTWHNDQNESQYKQALGWDQDNYLNVYVNSASGYLGYAYLPQEWAGDNRDGVVVLYETVGGRDNKDAPALYDQGRTLVHEVGHYLGLLHTFEGNGCYTGYTAGDLIADTNSENTEHYGCSQTSTCGTLDPIHNYMNYTDDYCMWKFTSEQANRAVCSLVNYRPDLAQTTTPTPPSAPTLSSPASGSTQTSSSINFQWVAAAGANNYDLYIRNSSGAFFDSWVGNVLSYTVSGFPGDGTQYSWSVYPRSADGIGTQSGIWTFTSGGSSTDPSAPTLSSPANGSTQSGTSITFQWTAVDGANNYDLYIRNSSGIFFDTWVGNVTSYTVGGFPTDGTQYSWSVYPRSNAGIGTQSEIWTLTSSGSGGSSGIKNGDMEDGSGVPDYWWAYDNDLSRRKGWKRGIAHSGRRSLMIKNSKGNNAYWQGETVSYSSSYPTSLTLGGWARATKVKGQGTFAIRFYIEFEDGTSIWYDDGLRFSQGTHGWEQVETTVSFSKGVRKIRPYCILFSARGYVWFDDVYANRQ